MSTNRRAETYTTKQAMGQNGKPACLRCGRDITAPRRSTFCGPDCADEFYLLTRPNFVRQKLLERDNGVCAICLTDTMAARPIKRARGTGHLWHADHIIPVIEGGGECGLDNYRTLCVPCHKRVTAELRKRLAKPKPERPVRLAPTATQEELFR